MASGEANQAGPASPCTRGCRSKEVIARTWPANAEAPPWVVPTAGGPLAYCVACLRACQPVLDALGKALHGVDLAEVIFPHPISGPLDGRQRLEFLRWHLYHHRRQIHDIVAAPGFPRWANHLEPFHELPSTINADRFVWRQWSPGEI